MKVKIYTDSIDYLSTNLLVLPFFNDALPLKGNLGHVDWRLNGFISKLFMKGKINGKDMEKILIPPFNRIPADRIVLVSLGYKKGFDPSRVRDLAHDIMETAHKLSYSSFTIGIPIELETFDSLKEMIVNLFKGIDKYATKIGQCEFFENLRITFAMDRNSHSSTMGELSKYLSSRSLASQALVNT